MHQSFKLPPVHGRKRTSAERPGSPGKPLTESMMHMSPHKSPNAFRTLDGRYVESKNPFSSPMMMEDDTVWTSSAAPGPSMPMYFHGNDNDKLASIPPRSRGLQSKRATASSRITMGEDDLFTGFPDHRFSFTGSPIYEHKDQAPNNNESLLKVRRLRISDDIVAASEQVVASSYGYPVKDLMIDTKLQQLDEFEREISPTDIMHFPPPTPVKARPNRSAYPSIRMQDPTTPFVERRAALSSLPARTPHPGQYMNMSADEEAKESKSRFNTDFDTIELIGTGCFGTVYKVLSRLDGCMYAVKKGKRPARGASDRDRMLKEVSQFFRIPCANSGGGLSHILCNLTQVYALAALSDQADPATFHIVRYHQAWMEDNLLYIQTELCSSTLSKEIAAGPLSDQRRFKLLREMLLALEFIHRQNMVHLDVKPENVLIKNDQYKLADFGLVTLATIDEDVEEGDSRFMSLELLSGNHSDLTKSDIFSLGATLYEICLGRPLPMDGEEWQDIRAGRLSPMPNTRQDLSMIVKQMMDPDPQKRPSASKLLQHPQLLSDEQKALFVEKSKVIQANEQLAAQARHMNMPAMKRGLVRANTWSGGPLPYM